MQHKKRLAQEETEPVISEEAIKEVEQIVTRQLSREEQKAEREKQADKDQITAWTPKTRLGMAVKSGEIKNIDEILNKNLKILEAEVVGSLLTLQSDLVSIGQSKGKFGGGKRRAWKQTQRKTQEGNVATFSALAIVGDGNGHVGIGQGRAKETLPARAKALRMAKLNVIKVTRGCGSFHCADKELHSIPFKVEGKCSSVRVVLIPAPQGTGLVIGKEAQKILKLAGIKDVYSKTFGKTKTSLNLAKAVIDALKKTNGGMH
jgi:small subunit ribosomal protein S5